MTSPIPTSNSLPVIRPSLESRAAGPVSRPEATVLAPRAAPQPTDRSIAAQVGARVEDGSVSAEAGDALKTMFDRPAESDSSTGSLMRTASDQLDQFDRVLEKLRANMGAGATYGRAASGPTGVVVDRLA